jgi:hypothetical protein
VLETRKIALAKKVYVNVKNEIGRGGLGSKGPDVQVAGLFDDRRDGGMNSY